MGEFAEPGATPAAATPACLLTPSTRRINTHCTSEHAAGTTPQAASIAAATPPAVAAHRPLQVAPGRLGCVNLAMFVLAEWARQGRRTKLQIPPCSAVGSLDNGQPGAITPTDARDEAWTLSGITACAGGLTMVLVPCPFVGCSDFLSPVLLCPSPP